MASDDYWDGTPLITVLRVRIPGFLASRNLLLRTHDIKHRHDQARDLYTSLEEGAHLDTLEQGLRLTMRLRWLEQAHLTFQTEYPLRTVRGTLGSGPKLLPRILQHLDRALSAFPLRGKP